MDDVVGTALFCMVATMWSVGLFGCGLIVGRCYKREGE